MRTVMAQQNVYNATNGMRPALVTSFRHVIIMLTVTVAGTAGKKAFVRGSAQQANVTFTSGATETNFHSPLQVKNLSDGTTINGSVGLPVDATGVFMYEVNTNLISWLGFDTTDLGGAVFNMDVVAGGGES